MQIVASTAPFAPHPGRSAILLEAHARPFFPLEVPSRILAFAFLRGEDAAETIRSRLDSFAQLHGVASAPAQARHHRIPFPSGLFRWEEHTEFFTFLFHLGGDAARFDESAAILMRDLALPEQPGPHLVSIDIACQSIADREKAQGRLQGSLISVSQVDNGQAEVASDFRPDEGGFVRFSILTDDLPARRLGSLVRDVMEIEVYRAMALLGLSEARRIGPVIRALEQGLASLTSDLQRASDAAQSDALLIRLTAMTAAVEAEIARTTFRFGATRAYGSILNEHLVGFNEPADGNSPAIGAFLARRNAPALRTCATMEANLADLAARLTRASGLLRTRIDVELARQNNELLTAMSERGKLQLRLQQTVEGLSVAAISYYVVGLVGYLLKGAKGQGYLPFSLDLAIALSVPVTVGVMALVVRAIRNSHSGR